MNALLQIRGFEHFLLSMIFLGALLFECIAVTTNALAVSPSSNSSIQISNYSPNCSMVSHLLTTRGVKLTDIPSDATKDSVHRFCEPHSSESCCTYKIETHLSSHSKDLFQKNTKDLIGKLSNVLGTRALKLNEFFMELLTESKRAFHNMYKRTYGNIYEENSYVFSNLFTEFENYYTRGKIDLAVSMDSFFNVLYQKMFTVLNSQYILDDKYLGCVSEHMKELKPFGDVPNKLSVQIKRSFVATRTYSQALSIAADLVKALLNVRINTDCISALTKMQQCSLCNGYPEKPCANYCVNVMKGCLQHYITLDVEWDNFVSFMEKVSERLLGPFNIVMVVEPINIKISEAIMNYQETERSISDQVFKGCGDPVLGRRTQVDRIKKSATHETVFSDVMDIYTAKGIFNSTNKKRRSLDTMQNSNSDTSEYQSIQQDSRPQRERKKQKNKGNGSKKFMTKEEETLKEPSLDKIVKDIRQKIKDTKNFWSNLPYQLCNYGELTSIQPGTNESCWNGRDIIEQNIGLNNQELRNFEDISQIPQQKNTVISQLYYLRTAVSNLRNAYNGLDVEWPDQEEPFDSSGYGSGGGTDDDLDAGSGASSLEETITKQSETPSISVSPASTGSTYYNGTKKSSSSGAGVHENDVIKTNSTTLNVPPMSLRRALLIYLFPIYMAWFGGIISDLL